MQLQCGAYGLGLSGLEVSKKVKRNKTHRAAPPHECSTNMQKFKPHANKKHL